MIVMCYLLVIFLALAFVVSVTNSINPKTLDRKTEMFVSTGIFVMIVGLCVLIKFLKYGG